MSRNLQTNHRRISQLLDRIPAAVNRELRSSYVAALADVRNRVAELYTMYQVQGDFTAAQATRFLRASGIEQEIMNILGPYLDRNIDTIKQASAVTFDNAYFRHAWAIDQTVGVAINWTIIPETAVRAAIGIGGDLGNLVGILPEGEILRHKLLLDQAFKNYNMDMRGWIARDVTEGVIKGDSVQALMNRLEKRSFMYNEHSAQRISRTETFRSLSMGSRVAYDEARNNGVRMRERWTSVLDDRVRPDHAQMDGRFKDEETGLFQNTPWGSPTPGPGETGIAEEDINCRCDVIPEVEGFSPEVRRQRDQGLIPYQNFDTWARSRGIEKNRYGQKYDFL